MTKPRKSLRARIWQRIAEADTWNWIWGWVPKPIRLWLAENVWKPVLGLIGTAATLALGVLRGIEPYYLVVSGVVIFASVVYLLDKASSSLASFKARKLAFKVTAISGSQSGADFIPAGARDPFAPAVVYAELEVEPIRFLKTCSATITKVQGLHSVTGKEETIRQWLNLKGYPREIGWRSDLGVIRTRDLVPHVPRRLCIAELDQGAPSKFAITAVDGTAPEYPPGWYKATIVLASESDEESNQVVEVAIGLGTRDHPPPPLICWLWQDEFESKLGAASST